MKLADFKAELLADPEVAAAFTALEPKYAVIRALTAARRKARLSQRMGRQAPRRGPGNAQGCHPARLSAPLGNLLGRGHRLDQGRKHRKNDSRSGPLLQAAALNRHGLRADPGARRRELRSLERPT